jgi:hypothetical protein
MCDTQIAAGMGYAVTDGIDILTKFTTKAYAAGLADQIFNCAVGKHCTACLN